MGKIRKVKLKEVVSEFIVPMRDKPKNFNGDVPWCRIEDIDGKYLHGTKSNKFVSEETIREMNLRVIPANSVLCTCSATIGVVSINSTDLCTNQTFIGLVPSKDIIADYLYYYLRLCKKKLEKLASITTIPYISRRQFEEFEIDYCEITDQQKIVTVLSALDAKIELNARINAELEAMAKTLYDYWFVQFAPHKSTAGKMVWNEALKREIPKDWKVESIENCCDIVDCLHAKKPDYEFEDEKYYLLQLENIRDDGLLDLMNKYYVPKDEYQKWISRIEVTEDDILITNAGRVAATAQVPKGIKTGIGRNITAIRPKSVSPTYLFSFFRSSDMIRQVRWNMDAGAFFSSLNVKGIKKLHIIRPSGDIEEQFENIVKPMRRKREELNVESQTLMELRDWLLPMLMNGQVTIK